MDVTQYITNIKYYRGTLEISCFIPRRQWARDTKITIRTKHIQSAIPEEYELLEILKQDTISNSSSLGYAEHGLWAFKVKKKPSKKKPVQKEKIIEPELKPVPVKEPEPVVQPEPEPEPPPVLESETIEEEAEEKAPDPIPVRKKTSTKRSIRGRMSKIAKNSKTKEK
tara:strand:+ start:4799 stop:5302 length:504 start_codon:yes stop_codon:yes gene_type:complete